MTEFHVYCRSLDSAEKHGLARDDAIRKMKVLGVSPQSSIAASTRARQPENHGLEISGRFDQDDTS